MILAVFPEDADCFQNLLLTSASKVSDFTQAVPFFIRQLQNVPDRIGAGPLKAVIGANGQI